MNTVEIRLAVDIGGTFTDRVAEILPDGLAVLAKSLTTPDDPSRAVETIIRDLLADEAPLIDPDDVAPLCGEVVHGTTLITNSIIERKGAKVALFVTQGTGDVLDIGRETRYDLYGLDIELPTALVPREDRFEVTERLRVDGSVVKPLDETELGKCLETISDKDFDAVAVCLLHAYQTCVDQGLSRLGHPCHSPTKCG